ncbi:MAG TPA: DUF4783 domain-containing protein [Saprospiraceae bacterium]|nr:DUF4783 domain-containing protein [Saprospiraceae bacterium]
MKHIMLLFLTVPFLQDVHLENITSAINQGDLQALEQYLDDKVEVALLEEGDIYVKQEAVNKLKSFFSQHPGATFQPVHKGYSGGKSSLYCIGDMKTQGKNYRVFMYIKVEEGRYFIQELRFEKN